jgi:hypothetical protein
MGAMQGPRFDGWFERCVARDSGQRFPTAGAAIAALAEALDVKVDSMRYSASSIVALEEVGPVSAPVVTSLAQRDGPSGPPPNASRRTLGIGLAIGAVAIFALVVVVAVVVTRSPSHGIVAASSTSTSASSSPLLLDPPATADGPVPIPIAHSAEPTAHPAARHLGTAKPAASGAKIDPAAAREQKRRLDALQRLCDQGTYSAAECAAKRKAILNGP